MRRNVWMTRSAGMRRNVCWIPTDCVDVTKNIVFLDTYIRFYNDLARKDASFRVNRENVMRDATPCGIGRWNALCQTQGCHTSGFEVHHITPLWVYSLEYSIEYLKRGVFTAPDFSQWNATDNLRLLCLTCHARAEGEAKQFYRDVLRERYFPSLCFTYAEAEKRFSQYWPRNPAGSLHKP